MICRRVPRESGFSRILPPRQRRESDHLNLKKRDRLILNLTLKGGSIGVLNRLGTVQRNGGIVELMARSSPAGWSEIRVREQALFGRPNFNPGTIVARFFTFSSFFDACRCQSGICGSSPQIANPARSAFPVPAWFAAEKGDPTPALSVER